MMLCLPVSSLAVNKCPFHGVLSAMLSHFGAFWWVISLCKNVPKRSAEVLTRQVFLRAKGCNVPHVPCVREALFSLELQCCWL